MTKPELENLNCQYCGRKVKVFPNILKVVCGICSSKLAGYSGTEKIFNPKKASGRPKGWALRKEFVDKDGNVFHKGIEQPQLKGTLPPTKIKPTKKKKTEKKSRSRVWNERVVQHLRERRREESKNN